MGNRQIWPDEIQSVEDLTFVPLDGTYVKVLMARTALIYILLMACALMILLFAESYAGWILLGVECVLAIAFAANMALARKIYDIRGYALRDKDISYRCGLFFTTVTTIPFSKIQQVNIRMNPLSRIFGLCYLDIVNGSQAISNRITIPGLPREQAEQIKSLLINNTDCDNE